MQGHATTPASDHLFKTQDNAEKLSPEEAELFHSLVAKLLWVNKCGQPDVAVVISFLCTRVQQPDTDDWKKLARVIKYLQRTKFLRLTMEASHLDQNHWFIDGAFAVHEDMKSHTGSYMTFGRGMRTGHVQNRRSTHQAQPRQRSLQYMTIHLCTQKYTCIFRHRKYKKHYHSCDARYIAF
jgi:hypothetical protein